MFLLYSFYNSPPVKEEDNKNKLEKYNLEDEEENDEELNEPLLEINNSGKVSIPNNQKEGASLNSDENIKIEKKKKKKKKRKNIKDLSFVNIILKAIFSNIDKITLIVMYFVAVKSINIIHFILVIIFLIQILLPNKIIPNQIF